jgi:hypothetical protein
MVRTLRYYLGMRVTRQTATELVVEDSSLWIAAVLFAGSLPLFYSAVVVGNKGSYIVGGFFLLCALLGARKSRFIFDARERVVRWENFVVVRSSAGSLAFDDIRGIEIEAFSGGENGLTYRLTLLTSGKPVPLSSAYRPGERKYTDLRNTIATFLKLETGSQAGTFDVDASVLELVRAGRKIDAIALLRSMQKMSLLDAKRIVDGVESGSKLKS